MQKYSNIKKYQANKNIKKLLITKGNTMLIILLCFFLFTIIEYNITGCFTMPVVSFSDSVKSFTNIHTHIIILAQCRVIKINYFIFLSVEYTQAF